MKIFIIIFLSFFSFSALSISIPKDNKVTFDVIRKNKVIGSIITTFDQNEDILSIKTEVEIEVKVLFVSAYKFSQISNETWINGEFVKFDGYTDFEDEREYYVKGEDKEDNFFASGMDGELILDKDILPLNYWNKDILKEDEVFDTQKGIVRKITVKRLGNEIIEIDDKKIEVEKYTLDATNNPKDKGPFPQYTLWYEINGDLVKFKFKNWKDKKVVTTQRSNWD
mgnify:CR=1 FL=1|tara:strand:+ start:4422 stop:5096 length:675 start_codon:yes stop_codon:yes gene_type:complete